MGGLSFPKGTVVEWWIEKEWRDEKQVDVQRHRVVTPTCANTGQVERAGACKCAPKEDDPAVVEYRKRQEYLDGLLKSKQPSRRDLIPSRVQPVSTPPRVGRSNRIVGRQKQLTAPARVIGSDATKVRSAAKHPTRRRAQKRTKQTRRRGRR